MSQTGCRPPVSAFNGQVLERRPRLRAVQPLRQQRNERPWSDDFPNPSNHSAVDTSDLLGVSSSCYYTSITKPKTRVYSLGLARTGDESL